MDIRDKVVMGNCCTHCHHGDRESAQKMYCMLYDKIVPAYAMCDSFETTKSKQRQIAFKKYVKKIKEWVHDI